MKRNIDNTLNLRTDDQGTSLGGWLVTDQPTLKQRQFNAAMERYENHIGYRLIGPAVSLINVSLQVLLAVDAFHHRTGVVMHGIILAGAFLCADFINGLVHMYMDNNDHYESWAGPLIASFHLHHKTPRYRERPIPLVYYHESGAKIWLAFFLMAALAAVKNGVLTGIGVYGVFYFAVLSSIAEVSHYLCHVPQSGAARMLSRFRILLPIRHHMRHHVEDNVNYAFLNGVSDPLLNLIAKKLYKGYKKTTDTHYALYTGTGTSNR